MTTFNFPLVYPTIKGVSTVEVVQKSVVGGTSSPFTGEEQVQRHQGQWFEFTAIHPPMIRADAEDFLSFFGKLNGIEGTFLFPIPGAETNRGSSSTNPGTPLVNNAFAGENDLSITGGPVSENSWLLFGDFIQISSGINTRYHKVLNTVNTDNLGEATLVLWPNLYESHLAGTPIEVQSPKGIWRLSGENPVRYSIDVAEFYRFEIDVKTAVAKSPI